MSYIEKSIEINVPVKAAYNQWTQFTPPPIHSLLIHHVFTIKKEITEAGSAPISWTRIQSLTL
jgi:hypothetical protein